MAENIFQNFYRQELQKIYRKFSYRRKNVIVLDNIIGDAVDLQEHFQNLHKSISDNERVLITYYNHFWEPILILASKLGLRRTIKKQNWLDEKDLTGILNLAGFEVISTQKRVLMPVNIPIITDIINKYLAGLPLLNNLCLIMVVVARPKPEKVKKYSVSVIIPARNEEKNIAKIIPSIPKFGKSQEFIFVEGHSGDLTWEEINKVSKNRRNVKAYKQRGKGKADAVKLGFSKAKGDILIIYDADRTVDGGDLIKFYNALAGGTGEFINGSRLIYPMEEQAMQTLNKFGNKIFSIIFSWILGQRFKDTLCGTKAFFKYDYANFSFSKHDPFGDFNLIFGAIRNNLKVIEIPVRYKEREYGVTNIRRFRHGLMLLKCVYYAYREFKAW